MSAEAEGDWASPSARHPRREGGGQPLPFTGPDAYLVRGKARHFLVYSNFNALLGYNCSNAYAVSAGMLADTIPQ